MTQWCCVPCKLPLGEYQDSFIRDHKFNCVVYQAVKKAQRLALEAADRARLEAEAAARRKKKSRK